VTFGDLPTLMLLVSHFLYFFAARLSSNILLPLKTYLTITSDAFFFYFLVELFPFSFRKQDTMFSNPISSFHHPDIESMYEYGGLRVFTTSQRLSSVNFPDG